MNFSTQQMSRLNEVIMPSSPYCKRSPVVYLWALAFGFLLLTLPAVLSAEEVDSETCLACHDGYDAGLMDGPHQLGVETPQPQGSLACVSCHQGGEVHIEDPSTENIFKPSTADASRTIQVCSNCHDPHREPSGIAYDHLMKAGVACTSCHSVHQKSSTIDASQACGSCHVAMVAQFASTSNHPVVGNELGCLDCHTVTAEKMPLQGDESSVDCSRCHQEHSGPFMYEHEAAWSFTTEGGAGCVDCHSAHGSVNDRLLKQTGDNLCRQCHGVPPRHLTAHDGVATNYNCIECHSAIHGSNNNPGLLDPRLGSIVGDGPNGCYCHGVME